MALLILLGSCAPVQHPLVRFIAGFAALVALFIDLLILFWFPWFGFDSEDVHVYRIFQLKLAGGTLAALTIWSFANVGWVVWQAQYLADGRPYCIQRGGRAFAYEPVTSLLDLNGLRMRVIYDKHDVPVGSHALLVVDRGDGLESRDWSYLSQHFVLIKQSQQSSRWRPSCALRKDFALHLPFW